MIKPPKFQDDIRKEIEEILKLYMGMEANNMLDKKSCYLTVLDTLTGGMVAEGFGKIGPIDDEIFLPQTMEKTGRLNRNNNHLSSWQSKNIPNNQYGGAVRTRVHIVAVAGLGQLGDEAVALAFAVRRDLSSQKKAKEIATISNNFLFLPLMTAIKKSGIHN